MTSPSQPPDLPASTSPPEAPEPADAFHPQATLASHDRRDEIQAYRPPSRLAFGGFLLLLVLVGVLLTVWGWMPGTQFLPR